MGFWARVRLCASESMRSASRYQFLRLLAATLLLAPTVTSTAWAADISRSSPPQLFSAIEPSLGTNYGASATRSTQPAVRRERLVSIDHTYIAPTGTPVPTVATTLFDGEQVLVDLVRVEVRGSNNYTWYGRVRDYDRSDVVLTVVNGQISGGIGLASSSSGQAKSYELQDLGNGQQLLQELDPALLPPEHPPGWTGEPPSSLLLDANPSGLQADSSGQIDIMIVYSDQTAAAAGGSIASQVQYAVDRANLSYNNSGVATQLRLVYSGPANYSESGDFNTDISRLATVGDGYMDNVDALRNTYAADVVSLFVENSAYCGMGYLNASATSAFTVVNRGCSGGNLSLAHEVGHNFGARHDPYVDAATAPYAYGHGYVYLAGLWRTVMAYDNYCVDNGTTCTRIPYFSNPSLTYNGVATGTLALNNNAKVHNDRALTVANFRTASVVAAPTVSTSPATAITSTGATLNGVVSANGASTTVIFEYGQTAAYGSGFYATGSPFAIGTTNQAVSGNVIGLTPCLTLHYRITATNSAGTTSGADSTFTTAGCATAPAASTSAASSISNTGATLNAYVTSNGAATTVSFQYGTTSGYGATAVASASPLAAGANNQAVSASIGGLLTCTTYHYRVVATNSAGTTNGNDATFGTTGCANAPQVTVNTASNITAAGASLSGTVLSNGFPATVAFYYGLTASYGNLATPAQSPVTTSGSPAAVNVTLLGLACGTTYHWALNAANSGGSAQSADQTFTTAACGGGVTVPSVATNPATVVGAANATLNGTVSSNGASTTVTFQYGLGNFGSSVSATPATVAAGAANQAVTATLTGLACASTYQYRVVGSNSAGVANGNAVTFTTAACGAGATSTTVLASNANPAMTGTSVTLQATVTGAAPTGTVAFFDNGSIIPGCGATPIAGSGNVKNGFCAISGLATGNHTLTAAYAGDGGNQPSTSPPVQQTMVAATAATCYITNNPYGTLSVTGGTVNGTTVTLMPPNTTVQFGSTTNSNAYFLLECPDFSWPANATLTVRSGAAGQMLVIKNSGLQAMAIAGSITAQGGGGAAAPQLYLWSPPGMAIGATASVTGVSGLTLDTLRNSSSGSPLTNAGMVDGGTFLGLVGASIKGAGAFKGNEVDVQTFGTVNNPVAGAQYLGNSLQVYPSSGTDVALLLNTFGTSPQFINVKVNGNGLVWMPSAWPSTFTLPPNSAPLPAGGTRPAGITEPSYGGGSIILQTTGTMTLYRGGANDFAFPGGIALKAGGRLDINGVTINQGWTTTGRSFQGIYLEAPAITSATPVQVWSNDLNWTNFSVQPTGHFQVSRLKAQFDGSAFFVPADSEAPHLNIYSTLIDAAANLQCWTCLVNFNPIIVQ